MRSDRTDPGIPVAPRHLPLLGHLPALARAPLPFVRSLAEHGDVVTVYLARTPAYVVTDPRLVRRILVADAGDYTKGVQYQKLSGLLGNSISTTDGTAHRDRRRLMQPAFHREHHRGWTELVRTRTQCLVDEWQPGEVVAVDDAMRALSLTVVARVLCSADLGDDLVETVQRDLPLVLRGVAWRVLLSDERIERLPLPANRRFDAANARLREVVTAVIARYRAAGRDHADLLSMLLAARDQDTGIGMDDNQIRDELINLLFAGTETTGNAMAWLWHVLGTHPEVEQRVHAEVSAGVMTDYTRRVVRETLRLYPPPWLVSRQARRDVRLGAHRIPAGAQLLFSPYAIQRDPNCYPEAERFDPDRWLPGRITEQQRHAYLAFGTGPQNCIGEGLAMLEMTTVAATILRRHRLVPVADTAEKASATLLPDQLRMRVEYRD